MDNHPPRPFAPLAAGDDLCEAPGPGNPDDGVPYTCLGAPGHGGDHAAYGLSPAVPVATWPQDPQASRQGGGLSGGTGASLPGTPPAELPHDYGYGVRCWCQAFHNPATGAELTALSVPCPECKRPAGIRCITLDTHESTPLVHKMRAHAAASPQTAELDGTEVTGRANMAAYPTGPQVTCECGAVTSAGMSPVHGGHCWRLYIARRLRPSAAVRSARIDLAAYDRLAAGPQAAAKDSAAVLAAMAALTTRLRAVLAEIDAQAGAS
jgi:hypothetical protein